MDTKSLFVSINANDGWYLNIHTDGTFEASEGWKPNEAARIFLDAIKEEMIKEKENANA